MMIMLDNTSRTELVMEREPHMYTGAVYELTAMLYCLVTGCLTTPSQQQLDLVPAAQILLDNYHTVFEGVSKYRRSTVEIIGGDGYLCDEYHAVTEDGYVLEMLRISKDGIEHNKTAHPVLFVHGLLCYSSMWLWAGKGMSLPYMLVDLGMDVWLGTFRGSHGSERHVSWDKNSDEYWQFSYDHVAMFDIPAMVNFVLEITVSEKINYIAHSMGGSTYFAMCNYRPDICKYKVKLMIGLASHTVIHNTYSPAPRFLSYKYEKFSGPQWFRETFGIRDFNPPPEIMRDLAATFCTTTMNSARVCRMRLFMLVGPSNLNMSKDALGYIAQGFPTTTSVMLLEQYIQFIVRKKWAQFDYGKNKNLVHYNSVQPPVYSLKNVTTPVALFSSDWDMMVSPVDTKILAMGLPNLVFEKKMRRWYSHGDFFWNADNLELFNDVIELINTKDW